jgi:hypothetical protein
MPQSPDWSLRVPLRSSRDAGPSARDRRLVFARAFGRCEGCGASVIGRPYTIAHRVERGPGGSSKGGSALWNLTLRCGSVGGPVAGPTGCHLLCEQRDEDLHDLGIWLQPGQNPRLAPVWLLTPDGKRIPVWLNDEGTYEFEPPGHASRRRTISSATATSAAASATNRPASIDWNAQNRLSGW